MNYYLTSDQKYLLRTVKASDAQDIFKFAKLPKVSKYLSWEPHKNIEQTKEVIENIFLTRKEYPNSFAIVDVLANKTIGIIDFLDGQHQTNKIPNIGYFLNPKYWNKGITSKALSKMLEIGFMELNYEVIGISHISDNIGSMKVIQKNNFKYIKDFKNITMGKHENLSIKYYELTRSDYLCELTK